MLLTSDPPSYISQTYLIIDMKIQSIDLTAVHVNHRGDWIFVRVKTDEGLYGLGELRAGRNYEPQVGAVSKYGEWLAGKDPSRINQLTKGWPDARKDRAHTNAVSAVEAALWDLLGKQLGQPVHALWGGRVWDEIRLYANINRATTDRTPAGFAKNAAAAVADGFDAVKLAPFDGMERGVDSAADAADGIACMVAVREAIGPDIDLLIDCHNHFTAKGSLEVADALRDLNLFWFEQPTPESNLENAVAVKEGCGLTLAGGEQREFGDGWTDVFEHKTMDIVMPDQTVVGGMSEVRRVSEMADAWGISTSPHGPVGPLTIASHVHCAAVAPNFLILEFGWGEIPWRATLTDPEEVIVNGRIPVNDRPGLGYDLNSDTVETHRVELP